MEPYRRSFVPLLLGTIGIGQATIVPKTFTSGAGGAVVACPVDVGVLHTSVMHRLRAYHALLVVLAVAAYATGEMGLVHAWLGYAVSVVLVGRVLYFDPSTKSMKRARGHLNKRR